MAKRVKVPAEVLAEAYKILELCQESFGYKLKQKRQGIGFTLREFSTFCGIAPGRLCEYEKMRRYPGPANFNKILHGFRVLGLSKESIRELQAAYKSSKLKIPAKSFSNLQRKDRRKFAEKT